MRTKLDDIPEEILLLSMLVVAWLATTLAWYDNHSSVGEALAVILTIFSTLATSLFVYELVQLYIRERKIKRVNQE